MIGAEWINVKEFLPDEGERVLVISKFHHISSERYTDYGITGRNAPPKLFRPDGYKPGEDVSWWMCVPTDKWKLYEEEKPSLPGFYLTMENYGSITSQEWKQSYLTGEYEFFPFRSGFNMGKLMYWREIPELPLGVVLKA